MYRAGQAPGPPFWELCELSRIPRCASNLNKAGERVFSLLLEIPGSAGEPPVPGLTVGHLSSVQRVTLSLTPNGRTVSRQGHAWLTSAVCAFVSAPCF
jgi:hypothetical protein